MSANSGLQGICPVCNHNYNEHNKYRCKGWDRGGRKNKEYKQCKVNWYICQHSDHGYQTCHPCTSHPGGGPSGTGPDGSFHQPHNSEEYEADWDYDVVKGELYYEDNKGKRHYRDEAGPSADYYQYSAGPSTTQQSTVDEMSLAMQQTSLNDPAQPGHARHDSKDSEDPLHSTPRSYNKRKESKAKQAGFYEAKTKKEGDKIVFRDVSDTKVRTRRKEWIYDNDNNYYYYVRSNGDIYWVDKLPK